MPTDSLRPEPELLLCAARRVLDPERAARLAALLGGPLDWEEVLQRVWRHRVLPTFLRSLEAVGTDAVPPAVLDTLRDAEQLNTARCMFMAAELLRVVRLLGEQGIRVLSFKGPVLAVVAYDQPALRQFLDLDILVPLAEVRRARDVLLAGGYQSTMTPRAESWHLRRSYWIGLNHVSAPVRVDLHWNLADRHSRFQPDLEALWSRARPVRVTGAEVWTFAADDSVLILAVHGFKHAYRQLKWVGDLCEWIRSHPDLDWARIQDAARELHIARILAVSLLVVDAYDGAVVPAAVMAGQRQDPVAVRLADRLWQQLFGAGRELVRWHLHWFQLRGRERWRDGLPHLLWSVRDGFRQLLAPTGGDRAAVRLPAPLHFLYWGIRPLRLFGRLVTGRIGR